MTNPDEELVTLEGVPVSVAERYMTDDPDQEDYLHIRLACRKALDARKSPYEVWRDGAQVPWRVTEQYRLRSSYDDGVMVEDSANEDQLRLMAAAPELLDALVEVRRRSTVAADFIPLLDAIRAAVPEKVASYLLDEGTK